MGHPVPGGLEGGGEGRLEQRGIRWQGGEDGAEGASAAGQRRRQEPGLQRREERQVGEGVGPHQAETGGGSGEYIGRLSDRPFVSEPAKRFARNYHPIRDIQVLINSLLSLEWWMKVGNGER